MSNQRPASGRRSLIASILVILGVCLFDQATKWWAMEQGRGVWNPGGIWGIIPGGGWLVAAGLIWVAVGWRFLTGHDRGLGWWGWGFLTAAGLSNLVDRVVFGAVRDFIYYPLFNVYGNVADILLGVGVVLLLIQYRDDQRTGNSLRG